MLSKPLRKLGFLTIGLFDEANPRAGHESTLRLVELGERLGFDSAWVRNRHLQFGVSSPVAVLAAASQLTSRIELGTAVIPLGWENPLRLAEDLATVDLLSGGRLHAGVSAGRPMGYERVKATLYPTTSDAERFGYERVRRLLDCVRGEPVTDFRGTEGFESYSDRVQPHSPGLGARMWYGGGSLSSARWAGQHAMNFLTSSVVKAETDTKSSVAGVAESDFAAIQLSHILEFRAHHPDGDQARVSQGLVVIPTDSATAEQRTKYEAYARIRLPRTVAPQGPERLLFAPDLVGPCALIADQLLSHPAYQEVDEVAFALPFTFAHEDYEQILTDITERLGPLLGWRRSS
ncbi:MULTISPECIES: LLM class flavin-dependent oxidoreductase [Streptomyces]|uniref:LLM class flavin-dependent oxidoreductase n=1 Tax=Streptomyces TaxID=1883 RepID=UPI00240D7782|nr:MULTISPECIES: LLM class flavin-dependent oxidoreductase [Streptomyces]WFB88540.1 LLM class flavin-dependent oxidoreductase [Streptomyces olivaceus]WGK50681.1 LLM class flavin-dependent oxidoreductase [Streptomyces sp. B146]